MAGIGFRIERMLSSGNVNSKVSGAIAAIFVSAGPWIATIISIAFISFVTPASEDPVAQFTARAIINYSFAGSLLIFSLFELPLTRYISDLIFIKQEPSLPSVLSSISVLLLGICFIIGFLIFSLCGLPVEHVVLATSLLCIVTLIWTAMIFLSATKDFNYISTSFIIGTIISCGSAFLMSMFKIGSYGFLFGFTLGQGILLVLLMSRIFSEFKWGLSYPHFFWSFLKKQKILICTGLAYALGVWCDKFINWFFGPNSEQINGGFFMSGPYDTSLFLAYLFVIPSLAFFVVKSETSFYLTYREYIINIEVKASYDQIEKSRENMMKSISRIMRQLAAFQLIFTGAGLVFSTEILELLKLDASHNAIFRFGIVGATFHVFFLFTNITLLYLAEYRFVLTSYLFFLATNSGFTLLNQYFHPEALGIGYAFSTLLTLCLSLCFLRYVLDDFDYFMFSKQPFALTRANQLEEGQFKL